MKDSFTLDDLIFLAYCETAELEEDNLFDISETDKRLKNEFKDLFLNSSKVTPEKRIIDNIMSYSRTLCVIKTNKAGIINFIMN